MSKANIHPHHLRTSGGKLKTFGDTVQQTGQKLEQTGQSLVEHASNDRSGVGSVVAKFTGRATTLAGKVFDEGGRVAGSAGDRLGKTADLYEEADTAAAKNLRKHHPGNKRKVDPPGGAKRSGSAVGKGGAGSGKKPKRVPGGGTHPAGEVKTPGGKDRKAPSVPGGGGEPVKLKGVLPDPHSASGQLSELLDRHHVTQQDFDSMRHRMNQPGGTANVTHEEATKWRNIREAIPLAEGVPVEKVLQPHVVDKYLNHVEEENGFNYKTSAGCFARSVDTAQMRTPAEKYNGLALNYPGTPFSPDMKSVYVLRTTVTDPSVYEIPFGGTSREGMENIGGTRLWNEPFNGNGVTRSDDYFVPEWESRGDELAPGSAIHSIDQSGKEHLVATYTGRGRWVPAPKGD